MVATVKGRFLELEGTSHIYEDQPLNSSVEATIRTQSVDTGNQMRDDDLRSENFLAADRFPTMTFASKRVEKVNDERWKVFGDAAVADGRRTAKDGTRHTSQRRERTGRPLITFS